MNERIFTSIDLLRNLTSDELAKINYIMIGMQLSDLTMNKTVEILKKDITKKDDKSNTEIKI